MTGLNREVATQLADLEHSYTSQKGAEKACTVCGADEHDARHEAAKRELAADGHFAREIGSPDAAA